MKQPPDAPEGRAKTGPGGHGYPWSKGRNVVLDKKFGSPTVTKSGVTWPRKFELEDTL